MKLSRFLVITFLCLSTTGFSDNAKSIQDCNKIEAEIEVINTSNGQDNGHVRVEVKKGDLKGIKYVFCEKNGKVININKFETSRLDGLKRGEYFCVISNYDCSRKIDFTIK